MTGGEQEKSEERREQREGKDWTFPTREESFLHLALKLFSGLVGKLVFLSEGPPNQVYI